MGWRGPEVLTCFKVTASEWSSSCWLQCVAADSAASAALGEGVFLKPVLHSETLSPTSHTPTYLGLISLNQVSYLVTHKSPLNTSRPKFHRRHWTATSRGAASSLLASFYKAGPRWLRKLLWREDRSGTARGLPLLRSSSGPLLSSWAHRQDRRPGLWTGQRRWPFLGQVPGASLHMHS